MFSSANSNHFCIGSCSYWVSFPELISHRSASPVCATGSAWMSAGRWNGILSCIFLSLCVDISFAVDVRSIPLDGVVAVSYELVIYNFTVPCIQSAHIFLYPVSLYQLLAGLFLSNMSRPAILDGSPARSYQLLTWLLSAAEGRHAARSSCPSRSTRIISDRFILLDTRYVHIDVYLSSPPRLVSYQSIAYHFMNTH